jgi:hypothetical protein
MEVDEDSPPRRKKSRKDVDLPKKKKKAAAAAAAAAKVEVVEKKSKKKGGLSQLLGKRRCAAEATEKIARAAANQVTIGVNSQLKMHYYKKVHFENCMENICTQGPIF